MRIDEICSHRIVHMRATATLAATELRLQRTAVHVPLNLILQIVFPPLPGALPCSPMLELRTVPSAS